MKSTSPHEEAAAAQRARAVLQYYLTPAPTVYYPDTPCVWEPPSQAMDDSGAVPSADVLLISSPYPRRRATLALLPHDSSGIGEIGRFAQPEPLPLHHYNNSDSRPHSKNSAADSKEKVNDIGPSTTTTAATGPARHPVLAICRAIPRAPSSPYAQLTYIFDGCCPFTALFATLRVAGFTRVEGRKALLHKNHSLLWVKHLMPSTVDQLMGQLAQFRKVNHFPGTHWLGRKDKLCLLMRRAAQRWSQRVGEEVKEMTRCSTGTTTKEGAADQWMQLTPQTWLLPQDWAAFRQVLHEAACPSTVSHSSSSPFVAPLKPSVNFSKPLFIVKPANDAGGHGIFLLDPGQGEHGFAAAQVALTENGVLPKTGFASIVSNVRSTFNKMKSSSTAADKVEGVSDMSGKSKQDSNCFVVQRYMSNPFLILGHKFDLRLYVVVTSYEPLRLYLYDEGLVRIAAVPYRTADADGTLADVQQLRAHLTNFTVNKKGPLSNKDFFKQRERKEKEIEVREAEAAAAAAEGKAPMEPKWSLAAFGVYLRELGFDWAGTQARIHETLRRTFAAVAPEVRAELRAAARRAAERGISTARDNSGISSAGVTQSVPTSTPSEATTANAPPPPCTASGVGPFFEFFGVDILLVHDDDDNEEEKAARRNTSHTPVDRGAASSALNPHTEQQQPRTLRPVLLEVNIMPSLSTHYSLFDQRIKANFIADALTLIGLTSPLFKSGASAKIKTAKDNAAREDKKASDEGSEMVAQPPQQDWMIQTFPTDPHAREACYTAAEEQRRAFNFVPLLPTPDSATRYASLLVDKELGVTEQSRYDAVLSTWAAAQESEKR